MKGISRTEADGGLGFYLNQRPVSKIYPSIPLIPVKHALKVMADWLAAM
jgi:hypothetical protein